MKTRKPKDNDQEMAQRARTLLLEAFRMNKEEGIDGAIWCSAMLLLFLELYVINGIPFEKVKEEVDGIMEHYKDLFEK